jgi:hypothetical protein
VYWQATEAQTPNMALFFLKAATPHRLKDAPGGEAVHGSKLALGKQVFADRCARCHSSKLPALPVDLDPGQPGCTGANYLNCFNKYWAHAKTEVFQKEMRQIVAAADFLDNNFLSTDFRVPVTLLQTNACSPLAANAIATNIWDNFSSKTYKELPSAGTIKYRHPYTGEERTWQMPAGGRGYTRPASLISLWSTAPYLLNNTVGRLSKNEDPYKRYEYNPSPSVQDRLWAFHDGIEKMLWPEKREKDSLLGSKGVMMIDRTTYRSARAAHAKKVFELLTVLKRDLKALPSNATDEDARRVFANAVDRMIEISTCPDYEVNRGHYFGTNFFPEEPGLSDQEKFALIEFLKTF